MCDVDIVIAHIYYFRFSSRMGGTCHSRLDADVTHVVFRDGRGATYEKALKKGLHLVNVLWLEYCKWHKVKVLEKDYRCVGLTFISPYGSQKC